MPFFWMVALAVIIAGTLMTRSLYYGSLCNLQIIEHKTLTETLEHFRTIQTADGYQTIVLGKTFRYIYTRQHKFGPLPKSSLQVELRGSFLTRRRKTVLSVDYIGRSVAWWKIEEDTVTYHKRELMLGVLDGVRRALIHQPASSTDVAAYLIKND